jgi:hypothetical protein
VGDGAKRVRAGVSGSRPRGGLDDEEYDEDGASGTEGRACRRNLHELHIQCVAAPNLPAGFMEMLQSLPRYPEDG